MRLRCPGLTITSGPDQQVCSIVVFVEGACEDVNASDPDDTRADYHLTVLLNGNPFPVERTSSNFDFVIAP